MTSRQFNRKDNWFFYMNQINTNNPNETILVRDNAEISGNLIVHDVSMSGHIVPTTDNTYDIGSATNKIRDLYLSNSTLYMGNEANDAVYNVLSVINDVPTFRGVVEIPDIPNASTLSTTLNILTVSGDASFNSNVEISGNLNLFNSSNKLIVEGDVSFNSSLNVSNNIFASKFTGDVSASALTVNSSYQMPTTIGSANQVLTVPASGNVLTFTDNTSGWIGTATTDLNMSNFNITGINQLQGASTMILDPAGIGDNTGLVVIKGNLQVDGESTIINSSVLDISDHTILLASAATNVTQTYGAGIEISGNKTFTYESGDIWNSNIGIIAPKFTGDVSASALTVNSSYQMPTTIGSANQVLTVPASGNVLTFTDNTSGWIGTATSDLDMSTYNITNTGGYNTYQTLGTNKIINTPSNTLKVGGVNVTAINKRTRTSHASSVKCVSTWTTQTNSVDNKWISVCWAPELQLFCAVAESGIGNRVMTSPDGINWTTRTSAADNEWCSVCWAAELGLFCAVSYSGTNNDVMTSSDGITWTIQTTPTDNQWSSVCWAPELSLFCVVSWSGLGNRVMTSPDGITWTTQTSAVDNTWNSVCWASELQLFCAVASSGLGNRVMTSPDGITWTAQTSALDNSWKSVCWSSELGLFCAVAMNSSFTSVMTSPDGITWTTRTSAAEKPWKSICWAPELGLFCAISWTVTANLIMTSLDGITWTTRTSAADSYWNCVCWAPELSLFCAVSQSGTANRVMTTKYKIYTSKNLNSNLDIVGNIQASRFIGDVSASALTINSAYQMPTTIGSANQVLTVPASGNVLTFTNNVSEWVGTATTDLNMSNFNITGINQLQGASTMILDPAGVGDNTGLVVIKGNLQVDGTTTTINSSVLDISDHTILLASAATNVTQTYGAGIEISGNKTFTYESGDIWNSNIGITAPKFIGDISASALTVNSAYQMPTTIGSANQVLTVPASGNVLTFTTPSAGGATSIINNQTIKSSNSLSNAAVGGLAVGFNSGNLQGNYSIALGFQAGDGSQLTDSVAIGVQAGRTQQSQCIAIGPQAGVSQNSTAIAIGYNSATGGTQGNGAISIGKNSSGRANNSIAIGSSANSTSGQYAIAIGDSSIANSTTGQEGIAIGRSSKSDNNYGIAIGSNTTALESSVAIGRQAGLDVAGGGARSVMVGEYAGRDRIRPESVAVGYHASEIDALTRSISIGYYAGHTNLKANSIAIGAYAGYLDTCANSIILNATNSNLNASDHSGCFVKPIANSSFANALYYNPTSGEIAYDLSGGGGSSWVGTATSDLSMGSYNITTIGGYNTYQSLGTNKIINVPSNALKVGGINVTAINKRTRTSHASAVKCVSTWTTQTSAANNVWRSVCWAAELGLFCAVASTGTGNRVMTSPDGITWTTRTSAADNGWTSVCWAAELGLFCAVAASGTGNRVMTSPDGINWTTRTSAADNEWNSVCWAAELGLFCAVAISGTGNRVMTSPDGITWTTRTSAADNVWMSVCWAAELGLFCAVSYTGNRVMTSPNGIAWTTRTSAANNGWRSVCWAPELGLFCAVAELGTGNRVMTSPDGITWTTRTSAADNSWFSVCWAAELGLFCAVATSGTCMTSPDGIAWTARTSAANNGWLSVCWAAELSIFCAVAQSGNGNRVMTTKYKIYTSKNLNSNLDIVGNIQASLFTGDVSASSLTVNSAYQMPTTIGSANQVLTVPASGNVLTFTTPSSGGATSIVNTSGLKSTNATNALSGSVALGSNANASTNSVAIIGNASGLRSTALTGGNASGTDSISIGNNSSAVNTETIAIGSYAGNGSNNTYNSVFLGRYSGLSSYGIDNTFIGPNAGQEASCNNAVSIGKSAGRVGSEGTISIGLNSGNNGTRGQYAISIGSSSGYTSQNTQAIAIGYLSGYSNQSSYSIGIGSEAGNTRQGQHCIAIGYRAGFNDQSANTIILNATGADYNGKHYSGLYVKPIRNVSYSNALYYDPTSGEIAYDTAASGGGGTQIVNTTTLRSTNAISTTSINTVLLGQDTQSAENFNVGIGYKTRVRNNSIVIGKDSGGLGDMDNAIMIGNGIGEGSIDSAQFYVSSYCISIGTRAGFYRPGSHSISIGRRAGENGNGRANCIILNAQTNTALDSTASGQFLVKTRTDTGLTENNINVALCYDAGTGIITKSSAGYFSVSDNLFKYQEKNITNALDIINKLQPVNYVMTISNYKNNNGQVMKDSNGNIVYYDPYNHDDYNVKYGDYRKDWYYEAGFIAQEVHKIPELQQFVNPGDSPDKFNSLEYKRWTLSYNSLFTYNVAATQELATELDLANNKISNLETQLLSNTNKLKQLEAQNNILKNALNVLLKKNNMQTI